MEQFLDGIDIDNKFFESVNKSSLLAVELAIKNKMKVK